MAACPNCYIRLESDGVCPLCRWEPDRHTRALKKVVGPMIFVFLILGTYIFYLWHKAPIGNFYQLGWLCYLGALASFGWLIGLGAVGEYNEAGD